jgi:molybdopterin converting factor small subunit
MSVRVRMFAALREAAGEDETVVEAGPLPRILDTLRAKYGEGFSTRLGLCGVLVDGSAVPREADVMIADGAEVALLPPVSGGAGRLGAGGRGRPRPARANDWGKVVPLLVLVAVVAAALAAGPLLFAIVTAGAAIAVLLDLGGLLARTGGRPVLVAAVVPGLGLPLGVAAAPDSALALLPAATVVMLLGAFCLVLVLRGRAIAKLGATVVAGLLVGLGAAGLVLLRATPDGVAWVAGLMVFVLVADVAGVLLRRWAVVPRVWLEFGLPLLAVAVTAVAVWQVLDPPFGLVTAMRFGLVAVVASVCGTRLEHSLGQEAGIRLDGRRAKLGQGRLAAALDTLLLASPAAYLLARTVAF